MYSHGLRGEVATSTAMAEDAKHADRFGSDDQRVPKLGLGKS